MTKKDFFILMIKLFGLYWIVTSLFSNIPRYISFVSMDKDIDTVTILWLIIAVVIIIGLFVLLVFQSDKITRILKLDKGFDDDRIEFGNLKSTDIIKIGVFVIGGLLILDNIPIFLSHSLFAFKEDIAGTEYKTQDNFYWTISAINLIVGYLLLTQYDFVAEKLANKKEKKEIKNE